MSVAVQRLARELRPMILAHLLSLPSRDRALRFGAALASRTIASYVERLDFGRDAVFGVHDHNLALVGVAHVAFDGGDAELGVSVLPQHRRCGLGAALFRRAVEHARNREAAAVVMQFLSTNRAMLRLAQKFGVVTVLRGTETLGRLELSRPSAASLARELMTQTLAACDQALRALVAGWSYRDSASAPTAPAMR
jgi:GNAT superfamily N-acetyltransferase